MISGLIWNGIPWREKHDQIKRGLLLKMSKLEQKRLKVAKYIKKYTGLMRLQDWNIDFEIIEGSFEDSTAAKTSINLDYLKAKITVYDGAFDDGYIEHVIKHELSHILTEPLYMFCYNLLNSQMVSHHQIETERERLTERIARLI